MSNDAATKPRSHEATEGDCRLAVIERRLNALPEGEALVEVMLTPWGKVASKSGDFVVDGDSFLLMTAAFEAEGRDLPIDFEHTTMGGDYATPSGAAPAAGWITKIHAKPGTGVFGLVKWNDEARRMIRADEYRYLSPVVGVRKSDKKAVALHSAGLTNKPAILQMDRVAAKELTAGQRKDSIMDELKLIGKELGLAEADCTVERINKEIGTLKERAKPAPETAKAVAIAHAARKALGLKEDASDSEVGVAIHSLKQTQSSSSELAEEMKALKEKIAEREVDDLIAAHGKGKINPNETEDLAVCRALAKENPERFKKLMAERAQRLPVEPSKADGGGSGEQGREVLILKAAKEFKGDASLQKLTTCKDFVSLRLQEAGQGRLTEAEVAKLVA